MDSFDYWRLCDDLTISQAALLLIGKDPEEGRDYDKYQAQENRPKEYEAAITAISNGLLQGTIAGRCVMETALEFDKDFEFYHGETEKVDTNLSTVSVSSLRDFLEKKGFVSEFFFPNVVDPNVVDARDYLDKANDYYSPKLAASVGAWEAVTSDAALMNGKTPKQAVQKWLCEHASEYGLTDKNGNLVNGAIKEIAKVVNWKPKGGATKTPNLKQVTQTSPPTKK